MKVILTLWVYAAIAVGLLMSTGCAGLKIGAEAGIWRMDEQQSSNATHAAQTKPLACMLWKNCDEERGS